MNTYPGGPFTTKREDPTTPAGRTWCLIQDDKAPWTFHAGSGHLGFTGQRLLAVLLARDPVLGLKSAQ